MNDQSALRVRSPFSLGLIGLLTFAAGGCTVLSIEEDQARKANTTGQHALANLSAEGWTRRIVPALQERAIDLRELVAAQDQDFAALAQQRGQRVGEGSPWTFVVRGEGQVTSIDRDSQRGVIALAAPDTDDAAVTMQVGPYVSGTAIRDALDFISFNDFDDQLQYAAVGGAFTRNAMAASEPVLSDLAPGDRIRFMAAVSLTDASAALVLTPIQVQRVP